MSTTGGKRLITNGPSNNQLIDAFRNAYAPNGIRQMARFTINAQGGPREILVTITGISHEDGTGHKFNFEGYYNSTNSTMQVRTKGFYDANTRKGTIEKIF